MGRMILEQHNSVMLKDSPPAMGYQWFSKSLTNVLFFAMIVHNVQKTLFDEV